MKATLEFNLPEDQNDFNDAVKGSYWKFAMIESLNYIKSKSKHGNDFTTVDEALLAVVDVMYESMNSYNLSED